MSSGQSLRIEVEIDVETSPVSGRCGQEGGSSRPFTGWTELFAALDAAVADARLEVGTGDRADPSAG
jgi:hypothetical protein